MSEEQSYEVSVEVVFKVNVEADSGDHAAEIVASHGYPLGQTIEQHVRRGDYEIFAIETVAVLP